MADRLTARSKDYSKWYTEVVQRAELFFSNFNTLFDVTILSPSGHLHVKLHRCTSILVDSGH